MLETGLIKHNPLTDQLAAISVGISKDDEVILDLDYLEDSSAVADGNFVMTSSGKIVEVQTTAEEYPISDEQFFEMMKIAKTSIAELCEKQTIAVTK
jgi:ribonuclease PH